MGSCGRHAHLRKPEASPGVRSWARRLTAASYVMPRSMVRSWRSVLWLLDGSVQRTCTGPESPHVTGACSRTFKFWQQFLGAVPCVLAQLKSWLHVPHRLQGHSWTGLSAGAAAAASLGVL